MIISISPLYDVSSISLLIVSLHSEILSFISISELINFFIYVLKSIHQYLLYDYFLNYHEKYLK